MIRILHCADLHLDTPFSLHTPREAERRRTELRADFTSVTLYIRTYGVQLCLISGDLFDSEVVTPETRALLEKELAACPDCQFVIAPGNHDPLGAHSPYRLLHWPAHVHVFSPQKECVHLEDLNTDVYGFGFDGTNGRQNPLTGYPKKDASRLNILCCHGEWNGGSDSENAPFSRADLAGCGFDYVALGHIHKGTGVQREQDVFWAYPGCIEGRGFDETGEKGVLVGTLDKGAADLSFFRISKRRYEIATCDVGGCDRMQALERARAVVRAYGADTALRLLLQGEVCDGLLLLPEELTDGVGAPYALEIVDQTRLTPSFTELEQSGTLKGVFYRWVQEQKQETSDPDLLDEVLRYGLLALDDRNIADLDLQGF